MDPLKHLTDPLARAAQSEPARRVVTLTEEFKQFAFKGNVVDLAIGVIIGAAFGKVVDGLVKNVLMPLVAVFVPGEGGYHGWRWVIRGQEIPFGLFLGELVNFLIVALVLFLFLVKFLGWLTRTRKDEGVPILTRDQELLLEIRDLLKQRAAGPAASTAPPPP